MAIHPQPQQLQADAAGCGQRLAIAERFGLRVGGAVIGGAVAPSR